MPKPRFIDSGVHADFLKLIEKELERIYAKNWQIKSLHEGYGLLAEEVAEVFDIVRKKRDNRDFEELAKECAQVATICMLIHSDIVSKKNKR